MSLRDNLHGDREFSLSILLVLQILTVFIVSPFINLNGGQYRWILDVFLAAMAFLSVFIVAKGVWRWLAIFTFILCLLGLACSQLFHDPRKSEIIFAISGLLFSGNVGWIVAHKVFDDGPITLHRIRGAIVIYLNIALSFALLDALLASLIPTSYSNLPTDLEGIIGTMVYYSLATITTIGYGDIVPIHPFARSLATLEAVIGQFYLGILIATLVGLHVSHRHSQEKDKNSSDR